MKLRAKLVVISLLALGVPVFSILGVALTLIAENGHRSQEKYFTSVVENIQKDVYESESRYRDRMAALAEQDYFLAKLYVYDKYWNYISSSTLGSDIQVLRGELERFLLAEGIDSIAVYRTDYDRYLPVLVVGNGTYVPDVVYRDIVRSRGTTYHQIADGIYVNFSLPVASGGKEIGLLLFQKSYNRPYFENLSLRYGVGLALYMQGLFRYKSLPGIEGIWERRPNTPSGTDIFRGTYTYEDKSYSYVGRFFDIGDGAKGYIFVGSQSTLTLGDWWAIFLRLSIIPFFCVLLTAVVFYLWGNELLGHIRELRQAADTIGAGDYSISLPDRRGDEFGELFRGFNKMAEDLREDARRLEENKQRLVTSEKMAALGEFAAGVAHEINNPLGIVLNHVQLLRTGRLSKDEENEVYRRLEAEIKRMSKLLGNLLHQTKEDYVKLPLRLKSLTVEMLRLFEPKLAARGVKVTVDEFPEALSVLGDRDALKQVFFNVMHNALQAIRHRRGEIRIAAAAQNGRCLVSVGDNGVGMTAETLSRIFEPFYTRKTGSGTGLGLALSRSIMRRHDGSILVDSEPERGTTVTLIFPRSEDHDPP